MARAALDWSLIELAAAAGVDRKTVLRFEQGETAPRDANIEAIRRAFESAGVTFADRGGVYPPK
jgi:transcriptional regulator with XRE-family HTH domain